MYTFRARSFQESLSAVKAGNADMVVCGERNGYQVQIQDSVNTNIRLLHAQPSPEAPQQELADLPPATLVGCRYVCAKPFESP